MSYKTAEILLPDTAYGVGRKVSYGFTYFGDVFLGYQEANRESDDPRGKMLRLSHGRDIVLLGAFVGFCVRLGKDEGELKQIFFSAGANLLKDGAFARRHDEVNHSIDFVRGLAKGAEMRRFNKPQFGWNALFHSLPAIPGVVEEVGGTGFYTRSNIFNQQSLVLEAIPPKYSKTPLTPTALPDHIEFYEEDIPLLAKTVCDMSLGDYRADLRQFLESETFRAATR